MIFFRALVVGLGLGALSAAGPAKQEESPRKPRTRATASHPAVDAEPAAALRERVGSRGFTERRDAGRGGGRRQPGDPSDSASGDRGVNLPAAQIDELLGFAHDHFPEVHRQLLRSRQADPKAFRMMLQKVAPPLTHLMRIARENPREAELLIRIQQLEMKIRAERERYHNSGSEQERAAIAANARDLIAGKIDARQAKLNAQIEAVRRQLDEMSRRYSEQARQRGRIIEDELARFTSQSRGTLRGSHLRAKAVAGSRPNELP